MISSAAGSFSVTMESCASSVMTNEVSTSLPLTRPASAALRQARADARRDLGHGHRGVEFFLAAVGQCD